MLSRLLLLAVLLPALTGFGPPALLESSAGQAPASAATFRAIDRSAPPPIGARSAILVDQSSGDVLFARQPDRRSAMASTTKIMTALVALDSGRLDQPITARIGASSLPGSSVAGLRAGETLPLEDMLYGLMLPSGNDAALAISTAIAPSTDAFVDLMNRRAAALGLSETHFTNPHGLDAPNHYSSARDLARLTRAALENPDFARVVRAREHTARGQLVYRWVSANQLLWLRNDVTGVKTGTTDAAGASLVASARRGDRAAIAVVLASPDRWAEADALLDYYFLGHRVLAFELPPSPFYRGLRFPPPRPITVPAWQVGLSSPAVLPSANGARVLFALSGRPLGEAEARTD